jgi:hypothetical protein
MSKVLGFLQPVAYAPQTSGIANGPVADFLVTDCIRAGTLVSFRFYPQAADYLSFMSSTVSFVLAVHLTPGMFVRLTNNTADSTMTLTYRAAPTPTVPTSTFNLASSVSNAIVFSPTSTCYVFLQNDCPVCAIGIESGGYTPIFPPVLPAQYTVTAIVDTPSADNWYVYFEPSETVSYYIPENWRNAWQTVRPKFAWAQVYNPDAPASYDSDVRAAEDALRIRLTPGQLTAIAFKPYAVGGAAGVWSVLITSAIPANTQVQFSPTNWSDVLAAVAVDDPIPDLYTWSSGEQPLPAGTVVTFQNLGGLYSVCVSVGTVTVANGTSVAIVALTAFTVQEGGLCPLYPCAATYTADYDDEIPAELLPGVYIRKNLWPSGASILSSAPAYCSKECNPTILSMTANATCLSKWITQPTPSSYPTCIKRPCGGPTCLSC